MGGGNGAELARGYRFIFVTCTAWCFGLMQIIHGNATGNACHIKGIQRGNIIARCDLSMFSLRTYGQLLLLQLDGELHATHLTVAKVQAAHNIFTQFVCGLEETETCNESSFIGNPIELWSTSSGNILQRCFYKFEYRMCMWKYTPLNDARIFPVR